MTEAKAKRQESIPAKLPFRQRLAMEYKPRLKRLAREFPYLTYYFDDERLAAGMAGVFERTGFVEQNLSGKDKAGLVQHLAYSIKKGHLVILHYRKKLDGSTMVSVLNEIRSRDPFQPFTNVIPIFVAAPTSAKQYELFRLLSRYDIRYIIFLPPTGGEEAELSALLSELRRYQAVMFESGQIAPAEEAPLSVREREKVEATDEYKALLARAEEAAASDPAKAIELFTAALELKPDFTALMKRGDAYYSIKEYLFALNDYREANRLERRKSDPYARISACCFVMVKGLAAGPDKNKAAQWLEMGMNALTKAEALADEVKANDALFAPGEERSCAYKGIMTALAEADVRGLGLADGVEERLGELTDRVFQKTKSINFADRNLDSDARLDYAILLARRRHYQEAERIFRELIAHDPSHVGPAFNNFAVELRKNGEFGKAFQIYMELLKFEIPDRDIVIKNLMMAGGKYALALRNEMKMDEAVTAYKNVLIYAGKSDGREWVLLDLAMTFLEMQDQAQASSRLVEAVYLNPNVMETRRFKEEFGDLASLRQEIMKKFTRGAL